MIYKNIKIVNDNSTIENAKIIVEDGIIKDIIPVKGISDKIAIPGLFDIHHHGSLGFDARDADAKKMFDWSNQVYKCGTKRLLLTTISSSFEVIRKICVAYKEYKEKYYELSKTKIEGINLEGPFISTEKSGLQLKSFIKPIDLKEFKKWIELSGNNIKVITIAPELKNAKTLIKECNNANIIVSIGHTVANKDQCDKAIEHGAKLFTHTWNAMSGVDHHDPTGAVSSALDSDKTYIELISGSMRKDIIKLTYRAKPKNKLILVTDAIINRTIHDGNYFTQNNWINVKDGVMINKDSGLPFMQKTPRWKLINSLRSMILKSNSTISETLNFCSKNPSELLGLRPFVIKKGEAANFNILDLKYNLIESL